MQSSSVPSRAIVLTSYRRPWNMERIAKACLATTQPCDVVLIDNADDPELAVRTSRLPPQVRYVRSGRNLGAGHRFFVAAALPHPFVMCIDDDIFLAPDQIDALFETVARAPEHAHGIWGETIQKRWNGLKFHGHVQRTDQDVDILNRVYAFKPDLAREALALANLVGFESWSDIGPTDDVFLSFAGQGRPRCHDLGPLSECATANERGVAVWRRKGFYKSRRLVVQALWSARAKPLKTQCDLESVPLRTGAGSIQVS